jgi:dTDP-4-dehydrorhamnose 3,5-epimerase-like enzyme
MTKVVGVVKGEAKGLYVDLRPDSPTFGVIITIPLDPGKLVVVPVGVGNAYFTADGCAYFYAMDRRWVVDMPSKKARLTSPLLADHLVGGECDYAMSDADRAWHPDLGELLRVTAQDYADNGEVWYR